MEYLIKEKHANVNCQDYEGNTCLHYLAQYDYKTFISNNKEDINIIEKNKNLLSQDKEKLKLEKYKKYINLAFQTLSSPSANLMINLQNKAGKSAFQLSI